MLSSGLVRGALSPIKVVRDLYVEHQTRVAFRMVEEREGAAGLASAKRTGTKKWTAEHVGLDPHFAHANLYADVAFARVTNREPDDDEGAR